MDNLQDKTVRISGIIEESIVDGPGIRFVVFTQGCSHNCKGCHNPQTHDYGGGTVETISSIIDKVKSNPLLDGITLSGGEPFDQAEACAIIATEVRKLGLNVIAYSGYLFEQLFDMAKTDTGINDLLNNVDILIDGPFVQAKKNLLLHFRGSENQRIIDLTKTLESYPRNNDIIIMEL